MVSGQPRTLDCSVQIKESPKATASNSMLDNSMLLVLWQQFGKGPTVFQHENLTALSNIYEEMLFFFLSLA